MTAGMWSAYAILLTLAVFFHIRRRRRVEVHAATKLSQAVAAGMTEPPSLHPVIDSAICCGSRACVNAWAGPDAVQANPPFFEATASKTLLTPSRPSRPNSGCAPFKWLP